MQLTLWYLRNWTGIGFYFVKLVIMDLDCDSLSNCFIIERRQDCSSREILPLVPTRSLLIIFVTQIFSFAHTIFFSHPKFLIQQIFLSGRHTAVSGESFNCESLQPVLVLSNNFSIMCNFSVQLFHILPVNQLIRNCFVHV